MLTLDGWDLLTLADVRLVNAALAARQNELIASFDYLDGPLRLSGRFGAWEIRPGGSVSMLEVALPISDGHIAGMPRDRVRLDIGGLTLLARLSLSLLPVADRPEIRELRFDFEASQKAGDGVIGLEIDDPDARLNDTERQILKAAAAACLAAHASEVSYIFASTRTRGSTEGAVFDLPHHDWAHVATTEGRQYLAIAGAFSTEVRPLRNIDPGLIATAGSAYLAFSDRFFTERLLLPVVTRDFHPKAPFRSAGRAVVNAAPIRLGVKKHGIWSVEPVIHKLAIGPDRNALRIRADTRIALPLGAMLDSRFEGRMAFRFDPNTRSMTFLPDPKPSERHHVSMGVVTEALLGWLIRLIVALNEEAIQMLVRQTAASMQAMNTRTLGGTGWTGVRDFVLGQAGMDGVFVMTDTRPA